MFDWRTDRKRFWVLMAWAVAAVGVFPGLSHADGKLTDLAHLSEQRLGAQEGTVGQFLAEDLLGDRSEELLTTYDRYADAIAALLQGKIRAVIMDEVPAQRYLKETDNLVIMPEPLSEENYAIGFRKGNLELRDQVDVALAAMKEEGVLASILEKYRGEISVRPEDIDLNQGASGGKLIMGTEPGFSPYEIQVGSGYVGIDIEMAAEIARRLNRELVIACMDFDALPLALASGEIDMICAGITVTEDRRKIMDFSEHYVEGAKQVAVVRTEDYKAPGGK